MHFSSVFGRLATIVFLLSLSVANSYAQGFTLHVELPSATKGRFTFTLYDTDSVPHQFKSVKKSNSSSFTGQVDRPTYAELRIGDNGRPLPLFIENSEITVRYNVANPEMSRVNGSLTNSLYRYWLEECGARQTDDTTAYTSTALHCLRQRIEDNHNSPIAPYLIDRYMIASLEVDECMALFDSLTDAATQVYHYYRLKRKLHHIRSMQPGNILPNFIFLDSSHSQQHISSLIDSTHHNLITVTSSACYSCQKMVAEIDSLYPELNVIVIRIDNDNRGWNAPWIEQLEIDHIPFIILIDEQRKIVARDSRLWELPRILNDIRHNNPKKEQ